MSFSNKLKLLNIFLTIYSFFIFTSFFMKQIYWYMHLMQNADNHLSNLLVCWLFCIAYYISFISPLQDGSVADQAICSFYSTALIPLVFDIWYLLLLTLFLIAFSIMYQCLAIISKEIKRPPSLNCIRAGSKWFRCTP